MQQPNKYKHLIYAYFFTDSPITLRFSSLELYGASQPEDMIYPFGPTLLINFLQYASTSSGFPNDNIEIGVRKIEGARLFTDEIDLEGDILYVGRTIDFFSDSPSKEIMMIYHKDLISITNDDLNKIFNLILSAFDFYNNIEKEMLLDVHKPNPEQRILSTCENLMGPMFILEPDYRILACSQNYS